MPPDCRTSRLIAAPSRTQSAMELQRTSKSTSTLGKLIATPPHTGAHLRSQAPIHANLNTFSSTFLRYATSSFLVRFICSWHQFHHSQMVLSGFYIMDSLAALIIRSWASREGLPMFQREELVALLDSDHLRSLPIPKKSRKWPMNPSPNTYRHHFYRQFARLLGWREQQPIAKEIHDCINDHCPDTPVNHKKDGKEEV